MLISRRGVEGFTRNAIRPYRHHVLLVRAQYLPWIQTARAVINLQETIQ
jgi:hypothetical protein